MSDCSSKRGLESFVEIHNEIPQLVSLIGPICEYATTVVGLLASQWNVPIISYSGSTSVVSDKKVYDTFSRTIGTTSSLAHCMLLIGELFKWNHTIGLFQDC